ncbi:MAG: hypothetical protein IKM71_07480, partial [Bacteroidaceae bacterium]|nr:hypothetical protein [Bacteroidaceae bacterium]
MTKLFLYCVNFANSICNLRLFIFVAARIPFRKVFAFFREAYGHIGLVLAHSFAIVAKRAAFLNSGRLDIYLKGNIFTRKEILAQGFNLVFVKNIPYFPTTVIQHLAHLLLANISAILNNHVQVFALVAIFVASRSASNKLYTLDRGSNVVIIKQTVHISNHRFLQLPLSGIVVAEGSLRANIVSKSVHLGAQCRTLIRSEAADRIAVFRIG